MINIMINVHCIRLKNPQCFRKWICLYVLMVENRGRSYSEETSKMLHFQREFFFTCQNGQCQKRQHTPKQKGFMWGQLSHAVYHSIKFHLCGYYNSSFTIKHKIDHHNAISQSTKISINNYHIVLKEAYNHTECHFTECGSTSAPLSVFHRANLFTNFTSHVILTEYTCAPAGRVLNFFTANIITCKVKYSHKLSYSQVIQGSSLNMGCPLMAHASCKSVNHIHSRTDTHTMAHRKTLWHNTVTLKVN